MKKNYISTFVYSIIFCFIMLCIVIYPGESVESAFNGLKLWFNVVCPALLPFFICIDILTGLGIVSLLGGVFRFFMLPVFKVPGEAAFAYIMSISSGYPVGAKITAKLRQDKVCTLTEGQRMLNLCSTSGPLFIIGAVATGILKDASLGLLLAVAHYLSALLIGFFMRFYGKEKRSIRSVSSSNPITEMLEYRKKDGRSIGLLMGDAVKNGVNLILLIGGFIILFSVIASALRVSGLLQAFSGFICAALPFLNLDTQIVSSITIGILEVTNGVNECAKLSIPLINKCSLVSFMMGFGGLSVNAQVLSIISETDLKFSFYLLVKFFQGIAAAVFTYILFGTLNSMQTLNVSHIFSNGIHLYRTPGVIDTFFCSSTNLLYMLLFLFTCSAMLLLLGKKQKHFSR